MRSIAALLTLSIALTTTVPIVHAQGGGAPSPLGQSESPQAASAAERAVEGRHERAVARSKARAAKRAAKAASAGER